MQMLFVYPASRPDHSMIHWEFGREGHFSVRCTVFFPKKRSLLFTAKLAAKHLYHIYVKYTFTAK